MKTSNPFFLGLSMLSLLFLSACSHSEKKTNTGTSTSAIVVVSETVMTSSIVNPISVSGNVEGNKTVRLGFMVAGKINRIAVNEGQAVKSGQLIASLDPENYTIAKELADIQVNQATDEFGRLKSMYEKNSLSESDYKKIDFALQGAKAQQKLQDKNLADTRLYSPIGGILLKKLAEPGEIVGSGTPILVVSDINTVKVNAYIPESQLREIRIGQHAEVNVGALGEKFTGKVVEVGGVADATTRAFTVKVEVSNPKLQIRPGMIAEVSFASGSAQSLLSVPATAILRTPEGQTYIFVIEGGKAFQRNISIGNIVSERVIVLSGLKDGEKIVTGGQHKLTNGTTVSTQD